MTTVCTPHSVSQWAKGVQVRREGLKLLHRLLRPVNGNGHSDEAPEPQQSLFSWAEFMAEEPVKPKGHSRKAQPATLSMFEWALTVEQEREEELVGAGR